MIYAAINPLAPQRFTLVVMWGFGPVYLDEAYQSRSKARYALNKLVGKDRKLVSMKKLYQVHKQRIDDAFEEARKPKPKHEPCMKTPIVIDASGYNSDHDEYDTASASFKASLKQSNHEAYDFMYGSKNG